MKILFCTNSFEKVSNGPAKFAHLLLDEADVTDIDVRILTEDIASMTPFVYKLDLKIPKPVRLLGQFIRMWKYHRAAMKIRKKFKFDILVYNNAFIGVLSCIMFKQTIGMINDDNNASNSLGAVLKRKTKFSKRFFFHYLEYFVCHISKCIIVNSEYLKENLIRNYNCDSELFKVMHKGIENKLVSFDRTNVLQEKKEGSILFVKTDFVRGGLYTLIDALKGIDRDINLSIVGPSKENHEGLKKILIENNISFELLDYLPPEEVLDKMRKFEIFCVPSKLEAFGVANLEAMAMGCKIVSTNIGGIPEAVGGNTFAWLVDPDNPIALQEELIHALDSSIRNKINEISCHLSQYSSKKVITRFKAILGTCLS